MRRGNTKAPRRQRVMCTIFFLEICNRLDTGGEQVAREHPPACGKSASLLVSGGAIGAAFGGIGAVPGAAIGSMVGCLLGGVTAGVGASTVAEVVVEKLR